MTERRQPHFPDVDQDLLRTIAESIAREAAREAARETARELLPAVKEELRRELTGHCAHCIGDFTQAQHAMHHSRLERLFHTMDKLSENFLGKVLVNLMVWGVLLTVFGYFIFAKLGKVL